MDDIQLQVGKEYATRHKNSPLWRAFKAKWDDKKLPRRGSKAFEVMAEEARLVGEESQALLNEILEAHGLPVKYNVDGTVRV